MSGVECLELKVTLLYRTDKYEPLPSGQELLGSSWSKVTNRGDNDQSKLKEEERLKTINDSEFKYLTLFPRAKKLRLEPSWAQNNQGIFVCNEVTKVKRKALKHFTLHVHF